MSNDFPVRTLKQRCPCCKEQGYLELFTCDSCKKVYAICELVFTQFTDPLNITMDKINNGEDLKICENCGAFESLEIATDQELAEIGLSPNDYE